MTAEEFEANWAKQSGMTVETAHRYGLYAEPCDCGEPGCRGWAMGHPWEDAIFEDQQRTARPRLRRVTDAPLQLHSVTLDPAATPYSGNPADAPKVIP